MLVPQERVQLCRQLESGPVERVPLCRQLESGSRCDDSSRVGRYWVQSGDPSSRCCCFRLLTPQTQTHSNHNNFYWYNKSNYCHGNESNPAEEGDNNGTWCNVAYWEHNQRIGALHCVNDPIVAIANHIAHSGMHYVITTLRIAVCAL